MYTYCSFLPKVTPHIKHRILLILYHIQRKICEFYYPCRNAVASRRLRIYIKRPLAFQTLQMIATETHLVENSVAPAACKVVRIKVELVVTGCTVRIVCLNAVSVLKKWINNITLRCRVTAFPSNVTLACIWSYAVAMGTTFDITLRLIAYSTLISFVTLAHIGQDCKTAVAWW